MEDPALLLGIIGAALTLFGFVMIQTARWDASSIGYDLVNLASGTLLGTYAYLIDSLPFIVINVIWALFSLKGVIEYFSRKRR